MVRSGSESDSLLKTFLTDLVMFVASCIWKARIKEVSKATNLSPSVTS